MQAIYVGEDVRHGGYYSVTDQAAELFKSRVQDFPPDETSLVGAALGYSQVGSSLVSCRRCRAAAAPLPPRPPLLLPGANVMTEGLSPAWLKVRCVVCVWIDPCCLVVAGLLPICEIPYAKYLDCAADMFFETVFMNWLNAKPANEDGAPKQKPAGVFFRLQGFGRGVFGGNFHTHNIVHLPPGLDVVCFSNGRDYAQGFRHGIDKVTSFSFSIRFPVGCELSLRTCALT